VVAVCAWVYGPVLGDYAKPLVAFGVICWAALWILRAYDSGLWIWGSILLPEEPGSARRYLALLSFACLFFELLVIRWLSVEVRVFAYFKNRALIACFLGFGLGVYASRRRIPLLYVLAIVALLGSDVAFSMAVWGTHAEQGFLGGERGVLFVAGVILITMFFSISALLFVPLGQAVGYALDHDVNPIPAYSLNVAASLAGVWAFTLVGRRTSPRWPLPWRCRCLWRVWCGSATPGSPSVVAVSKAQVERLASPRKASGAVELASEQHRLSTDVGTLRRVSRAAPGVAERRAAEDARLQRAVRASSRRPADPDCPVGPGERRGRRSAQYSGRCSDRGDRSGHLRSGARPASRAALSIAARARHQRRAQLC